MSTWTRSIVATAVIVLAVGATALSIRLRPAPPPPPIETVTHVFTLDEGAVSAIAVVSRRGELRAERGGSGWRVAQLVLAPTDSGGSPASPEPTQAEIDQAVAELVRQVVALPEIDRFPRGERELREFGLDRPQLRITLTLASGATESLEVGELTITSTGVYARQSSRDDVLEIGSLFFNEVDAALYRLRGLARSPDPKSGNENARAGAASAS